MKKTLAQTKQMKMQTKTKKSMRTPSPTQVNHRTMKAHSFIQVKQQVAATKMKEVMAHLKAHKMQVVPQDHSA